MESDLPEPGHRRPHEGQRNLALIFMVLFVTVAAMWGWACHHDPQLLERDWQAFDLAAHRATSSGFASIYSLSAGERLPFLYPPFAIWLTLPLALVGPAASYVLVALCAVLCLAGSVRLFSCLVPDRRDACWLLFSAALLSGPFLLVFTTGQNSAAYVLAIAAGTVLLARDRPWPAGAAWAFLLVKPNIAVFFLVFLLAQRSWKAVGGFAASAAVLMLSTLFMGPGVWAGMANATRVVSAMLEQAGNWSGQPTVLAALRLWGPTEVPMAAMWVAVGLPFGAAAVCRWSARHASPAGLLRLVGTVCLAAVAFNPRLYAYDALLLIVPAASWYLSRELMPTGRWRLLGALMAGSVLPTLLIYAGVRATPLSGVAAALWLAAELVMIRLDARVSGIAGAPTAAAVDVVELGASAVA